MFREMSRDHFYLLVQTAVLLTSALLALQYLGLNAIVHSWHAWVLMGALVLCWLNAILRNGRPLSWEPSALLMFVLVALSCIQVGAGKH